MDEIVSSFREVAADSSTAPAGRALGGELADLVSFPARTEVAASEPGKNTIASRLVDRLHEAILAGELKPGAKINLEQVRRTWRVSLSPLREALARLIAVGLVELHDNRGYSVTQVSLGNLEEIIQVRMEVECRALAFAIAQGDLGWESDLMRALHRLNRTVRNPGQPETLEAWEHAHRNFHLALIAGCKMPLLINFCRMLHSLNDRYRRIFLVHRGGRSRHLP